MSETTDTEVRDMPDYEGLNNVLSDESIGHIIAAYAIARRCSRLSNPESDGVSLVRIDNHLIRVAQAMGVYNSENQHPTDLVLSEQESRRYPGDYDLAAAERRGGLASLR